MEEGAIELALLAAVLFLGGLVLETRVLLQWRANWYFAAALPLGAVLVPIPRLPTGEGRTPSVRWEAAEPGLVRFWADPSERRAPSGLHGVVLLHPRTDGMVELTVRWAPPWVPLLAALWLAMLGLARGEGQLTVPLAAMIAAAILFVYGERSRRVAAELRHSFVSGPPEEPSDV